MFGKNHHFRVFVLTVAAALSIPAVALCAEVTIQDTSGFTRAASQVEGPGKIEFSVLSSTGAAGDAIPVTLTNSATGEVLTATSANGLVSFPSVSPGVWTVATTVPGATFTNVAIASAVATGGLASAGVLVPAVVVGGAGAGAAVAISNSNGSSNNEISPSS